MQGHLQYTAPAASSLVWEVIILVPLALRCMGAAETSEDTTRTEVMIVAEKYMLNTVTEDEYEF